MVSNIKPESDKYAENTALKELSSRVKQLKEQIQAEENRLEKILFDKKAFFEYYVAEKT